MRQPTAPWRVIYGRLNVGGTYTLLHETGSKNEFVNLVITLTGHEVEEIEKVRFNGEEVPLDGNGDATGTYAGHAHVEFGLGDPDQVAYANLISAAPTKWTSDHRQRNRANAYIKLKWNQELYPNGIPNITFDIKGRKVYDPRLGYNVYSANPALCLADFLSKKENFAVRSREYENAAWIKSASITVTATNISAPDGSLTARELTTTAANQSIRQNGIIPPEVGGRQIVYIVWLRKFSGSDVVNIRVKNQADTDRFALFTQSVTTTWKKFVLAGTMDGSDTEIRVVIDGMDGAAGAEFEMWESQVRYGTVDGPMLHTGELAIDGSAFGLENTWEEIDEDELIAQANICDEDVALSGGGDEKRYTCNGSFLTSEDPRVTVKKMLSAMGGTPTYIGGKWSMLAAAWRAPTVSLDENDLRGSMQVQSRISRRELFNAVKGVYVSEANKWQPSDFPPVTSATYEAEDNNERIWKDVEYPYTNTASTAQRLSKIDIQRIRRQATVRIPCKLSAYQVQKGNVLQYNNTRFGWTDKTFEVADDSLLITEDEQGAPAYGVDLILRETDANVYAWSAEDVDAPPPGSPDLPGPKLFPGGRSQFPPDSELLIHFSFNAGTARVAYGRGPSGVKIAGEDISEIEGISGKGISNNSSSSRFDFGSDFIAVGAAHCGCFWTKEGTGTEGGLWRTMFGSDTTNRRHIQVDQSTTELGISPGGGFQGCGFFMDTLDPGWHFILANAHDSVTDFYVDNEYVGTAAGKVTEGIRSVGNDKAGNNQSWGAYDEARIYDRDLTEAERTSLYLNPQGAQTLDNVPDGFDRYGAHQLMRNPDFEVGDRDWTKSAGFTIENDAANAYDGNWVGKFVGTGTAAFRNAIAIPIEPGEVLMGSCMIKRVSGDGNPRVRISWRDSSKSEISVTLGSAVTSSSYALSRVVAVAPAGTFFAVVEAIAGNPSVSQTAYYDQFQAAFFPKDADDIKADGVDYFRFRTHTHAQLVQNVGTHGQNFLFNPGFEAGSHFWQLDANRVVQNDSAKAHEGNRYLEITATLANSSMATDDETDIKFFEVNEGDVIVFGGWAYRESGNRNVRYMLRVTNKDKANPTDIITTDQNTAAWAKIQAVYVIPAGKKYLQLLCVITGGSTTTVARFDDAVLARLRGEENQAVGVTANPTYASNVFAVIPEMTLTITPKTDKVLVIFGMSVWADAAEVIRVSPHVGGVDEGLEATRDSALIGTTFDSRVPLSINWLVTGLTPGVSVTIDIRWLRLLASGTLTAFGVVRSLQLEDIE